MCNLIVVMALLLETNVFISDSLQKEVSLTLFERARSLYLSDNKDSLEIAIGILDSTMSVDSKSYDLFLAKVRVLWKLRDREACLTVLDTAMSRIPEASAHACYSQAIILSHLGRDTEAREKYEKCLTMAEQGILDNPEDIFARVSRAWMLVHLGRKDDAIEEMDSLQNANPMDRFVKENSELIKKYDRFDFLRHYFP